MPVSFNSPARNLFLLGSTGATVVSNFFKTIDKSAGTDGVYLPDEIKYNFVDQKYVLAGSASDSNSKGFGWFEKRNTAGSAEWVVNVEATQSGVDTTLRAMELDSNNNLIVVGKTGDVPWIAKYSNGGVIDWQSTTNSANVEYTGVTSDSNGQYYACGSTTFSGFIIPSEAQAFVEKFDANGNPGWGKSAFMLGRKVNLRKVAANSRGEVVAVGYLEDDSRDKGYIVKIDTNTGEVLWDRTISTSTTGYSSEYDKVYCEGVYIDSNDQIYVVGRIESFAFVGTNSRGFVIKYTAEGNMVWQRETPVDENIQYYEVKSDGDTQQTIVLGTYSVGSSTYGLLSKYNRAGNLVWKRTIESNFVRPPSVVRNFRKPSLDADPSFYYILYSDDSFSTFDGYPDRYTFGKVSSTGNGLGDFQYEEGTGETIDYEISDITDEIGRLSDGSVRNDSSDLITYPFNANKLLFDDLATQVSNKKRQMDGPDSFEYSGSPAIRPADFQELNLLGDVYSGSGDWLDQSGKGNDGVVNGPIRNVTGYWAFDGVDDYIQLGFNTHFPEITLETWAYKNTAGVYHSLIGKYRGDPAEFPSQILSYELLFNDANGIRFHVTGSPVDYNPSGGLSTNTWYHIVGTYSGTTVRIFVNGIEVASGSRTAGNNTVPWRIGASARGANFMNGRIGEVRIYPRALTAAQVFQNYNATKSKYLNEAPDTAPKIGPGIVYGSNLLLNYDFGNRVTYDRAENLLESSEEFDSNYWVIQQCIVEDMPDELSPVGSKGVKKVSVNAVGPTSVRLKNFTTVEGGFTYTASVYVKDAGAPAVTLFNDGTNSDPNYAGAGSYYNLSGPNAGQVFGSSADSAGMEYVGNGWWRCWFTDQYDSGGSWHPLTIVPQHTGAFVDVNSQTNANGKGCYIWGAQVEKKSTLGRYIKTYGTAITPPTTVKNLSSTSYSNTIPNGIVYNSGVLEHNQAPLIFNPGVSHNSNTNGFTWEIWMALDSTPTGSAYIFSADSNNLSTSEGLRIDNNRSVWFQRNNNSATGVGVTLGLGNWNHFVITMTGPQGLTFVYHNGTEELVNNGTSAFDPQQLSSVGSSLFTGKVAEIRVYDRALSGTEVSQNFNATRSKYGV